MTDPKRNERRRYPRFKVPRTFRLKARIKTISKDSVDYLEVHNLSMGGAELRSESGVDLEMKQGDMLDMLLFSGGTSLHCVARVATVRTSDGESVDLREGMRFGVELVGIDEKSRRTLADMVERLCAESASKSK